MDAMSTAWLMRASAAEPLHKKTNSSQDGAIAPVWLSAWQDTGHGDLHAGLQENVQILFPHEAQPVVRSAQAQELPKCRQHQTCVGEGNGLPLAPAVCDPGCLLGMGPACAPVGDAGLQKKTKKRAEVSGQVVESEASHQTVEGQVRVHANLHPVPASQDTSLLEKAFWVEDCLQRCSSATSCRGPLQRAGVLGLSTAHCNCRTSGQSLGPRL